MQSGLLHKLFGKDHRWHGPCTVVLNADATIQTSGTDSIVNAGAKIYAPRLISGRVSADAVCFLSDESALLVAQVQRVRQATGDDIAKQTFVLVDAGHIAAIEFTDDVLLKSLNLSDPPLGHATGAVKAR